MDESDRALFTAMVSVAAGLELGSTLERIVRAAASVADARYAVMGVIGASGNVSEFIQVGFDDATVEAIGSLPQGLGVLAHMVAQPVALRLDDLGAHPTSYGFPPHHPPMHTFLGVPVRVRGELFGNLYLTEKNGGEPFTEDDEEAVVALAAAAGVAIGNARLYERTRGRERWQRAVTEIDTAVLSGADAGDVLQLVAARSRRLADADLALICLPHAGDLLVIEIAESSVESGDSRPLMGLSIPADSILSEVYSTGHVRVGTSLGIAADVGDLPLEGPVIVLPLRTPDRVLGALALVRRVARPPFTAEALELAEGFATQAAVTLVLAETRIERERLAVFEDRDRIGRDLHDLVIQRLFATGVHLQSVAKVEGLPTEVSERIEEVLDDLDATVKEIRHTIFALHNAEPGLTVGLRSRVLDEIPAASAALGFTPSVTFAGAVDALVSEDLADHLVAALREGLTNAARHANSSRVWVSVVVADGVVALTVDDNGRGIEGDLHRSGLANLDARARHMHGEFLVDNRTGGGTRVVWQAPIES
ncbi:MAG: GAF domain-containing protein [Actinobacteria bacterium]|uniref:Unannotated protein n=1 Tax=freshwater metagenome TaxID=449393 RepID=A0A6J7IJ31_9ZZZZ|nr:GAF domain-containing protein [Actinomycetota bacterium]